MSIPEPFTSTAPGRLCLFGEHQDYLGMPVIAAALPLQCRIEVSPTMERALEMKIPALDKTWRCHLDNLPSGAFDGDGNPDFAMAAVLEAVKDGWNFPCGAKCISTTDIPLQAGCSSSSAFVVAWINMLAHLASVKLTPLELAKRAHQAEVIHYNAPGGTMDHVTSSLGVDVLRIGPGKWDIQPLKSSSSLGVWVLADSGQPKDTMGHLKRCKGDRLALLERLGGDWDNQISVLSEDEIQLLNATHVNRDQEANAARTWELGNGSELAEMMNRHHAALRDGLKLSTPRIEAMREAALKAGAWGYKLVGSGGGGCAVAWAPADKADVVAEAMKGAGAVGTWIIQATEPGGGAAIEERRERD